MILDQYGNPYNQCGPTRKFNRNAENDSLMRPWENVRNQDINELIPPRDRLNMLVFSRMLCENWSPARAISRQIPMFAVGNAWKPSINVPESDTALKAEAEMAIRQGFCNLSDIQGNDFTTVLYFLAVMLVRDGEAFYILTERKGGFPSIQLVSCHNVGQREMGEVKVAKGDYKGLMMRDGVIYNRLGTPVAYRILAKDPKNDRDVSARSMKHVMDSDYPEAIRAYPAIAHALNDGRDALQSHEWERINMLARSGKTFIEHNETGMPDTTAGGYFSDDGTTVPPENEYLKTRANSIQGGMITTVRAGSGYKLESIGHETPGEVWESFQDRIVRKLCAGVPWPYSFVWGSNPKGGGTSERREIMQARQTIEDMQSTLERHAKIIVGYAYQKMVKIGMAPATEHWYKWTFAKPPKITIDDGRVTKAQLELWRAGVISDEDLLADMGKDHDEHFRSRFQRAADKEIMFADIQKAKKVTLDPRYKGMFNMNEMTQQEAADKPEKETSNEKNDDNEDD